MTDYDRFKQKWFIVLERCINNIGILEYKIINFSFPCYGNKNVLADYIMSYPNIVEDKSKVTGKRFIRRNIAENEYIRYDINSTYSIEEIKPLLTGIATARANYDFSVKQYFENLENWKGTTVIYF